MKTSLRVAIVSKGDKAIGGANRVAAQLADLINAAGGAAHLWLVYRGGAVEYHHRELFGKPGNLLFRMVKKASRIAGLPDLPPLEYWFLNRAGLESYDIVHFHDLASAISPITPYWVSRRKPTLWTFHDCSPFTGGCHYPLTCEKYKTRCGECPQLGNRPLEPAIDFTGYMQDVKRFVLGKKAIQPVVPSRWTAEIIKTSGLGSLEPVVIPNGIDIGQFSPMEKAPLRAELGLPADRKIILLTAADLSLPRKGAAEALKALRQIRELNPFLLLVGGLGGFSHSDFQPFDCHFAGSIKQDDLKARYYAVADILINCSWAETFSLVTAETMSCGVPTVGFESGGIAELIEHKRSGYLAPPGDIESIVRGLILAFGGDHLKIWGKAARARIESHFSLDLFLNRHLELYEKVRQRFESRP